MFSDAMVPDSNDLSRDDEIVAEVRATRDRLAGAVGYDFDRQWDQFEALEAEERARGRTVLAPSASRGGNSGAAA